MSLYHLLRPFVFALSPETAHHQAINALKHQLVLPNLHYHPKTLHTNVFGIDFPNPIGLAAGFDKNAEVIPGLAAQGFGFVEVGTVTPKPQFGNPKPRLFRLAEDQAIINRMGFNNDGLDVYTKNLKANKSKVIVGGNIGKNKDSEDAVQDYLTCMDKVYPHCDYLTINISSPNTPGLRDLQQREPLTALLSAVMKKRQEMSQVTGTEIPVLVKIAPDLEEAQWHELVDVAMEQNISGMIVSNTTIARPPLRNAHKKEAGGLSGKPLFQPSTELLGKIYQYSEGKLPLIGVGGIASAEDAYQKIQAGASLVQLYSGLVYEGFGLVHRIKEGLVTLLEKDGVKHISEAVGQAS